MQGTAPAVQILNWVNHVMWGIVWKGFIGTSLNRFLIILMMYSFRFMTKNEKKPFPFLGFRTSKEKKNETEFFIICTYKFVRNPPWASPTRTCTVFI